jgi:hypothetical protein
VYLSLTQIGTTSVIVFTSITIKGS